MADHKVGPHYTDPVKGGLGKRRNCHGAHRHEASYYKFSVMPMPHIISTKR
jgi:hypothetical protein